ncbi:Acyltransferase family protein [uncultured archaeon]|nr:Acyltransferase family protein [uncultured archaeon]
MDAAWASLFAFDFLLALAVFFLLDYLSRALPARESAGPGGRIELFDWLKGIAILAVVVIHLAGDEQQLLHFAVPLFLVCSGYLLMDRYGKEGVGRRYWSSLFWRLLLPYALIVAILDLAYLPSSLNLAEFGRQLLLGYGPVFNCFENYFIPLIIGLYLLFPLMRRPLSDARSASLSLLLILLLSAVFQLAWDGINSQAGVAARCFDFNRINWELPLRYLFCFAAGMALARIDLRALLKHRRLLALATLLSFLCIAAFWNLWLERSAIALPILVFLLLYTLFSHPMPGFLRPVLGVLAHLGRYSLGIYLFHYAFWRLWVSWEMPANAAGVLLGCAFVLVCSAAASVAFFWFYRHLLPRVEPRAAPAHRTRRS